MKDKLNALTIFYKKNYKFLMIIPAIMFLISIFFIINTISVDGTPIYRDVSLKGGLSAIFEINTPVDSLELKEDLENNFVSNTFVVSDLFEKGVKSGFIVDTDLDEDLLKDFMSIKFENSFEFGENYSSNFISPLLSNAFFKQAVYILLISLFLMASVVFLYFRAFVPSFAVVLSAIFDIIVTVGILNMLEFKISVAGVGALLMLIGYSIDTDILLTNRVFKEKGDEIFEKTFFAFKTGSLMSFTTLIAGFAALILTNSDVIFEIAFILVIGLLVDYVSTWIQNASMLLWWMESKNKR